MIVELADYPEVEPLTLSLEVQVNKCKVESLVNTNDITISPFNPVFELPAEFDLQIPLFEAKPACDYTRDDIQYEIVSASGAKVDTWISIDSKKHLIKVFVEEKDVNDLYSKEFSFKLRARLSNLFLEEQSFKVTFPEKPPEPELPPADNIPEIQTFEEDQVELGQEIETEETISISEVSGWEGWKSLLLQLGLDIDLPKPKQDPNYRPTPPRASIGSINAYGKVSVKFSEPVFELEDVTT